MVNWKERWEGSTVSEMWTYLTGKLTDPVNLHVPLKRKEGEEEKDYPSRHGRRLGKEVKHGRSTGYTVQEETSTDTSG